MKLAQSLLAMAMAKRNSSKPFDKLDAIDLMNAASILELLSGQMQSHSLHMDGTASYRFTGGWPLSSVRARTAEEALLKCVEMIEREANHGS